MLRTWCEHQLSCLCFMTVRAVWPAFPCPCSHAFPSESGSPECMLSLSGRFIEYCIRTPKKGMNTTRVLPLPGLLSPSSLLMASDLSQLSWLLAYCLWCFAVMFPKIVPPFPTPSVNPHPPGAHPSLQLTLPCIVSSATVLSLKLSSLSSFPPDLAPKVCFASQAQVGTFLKLDSTEPWFCCMP